MSAYDLSKREQDTLPNAWRKSVMVVLNDYGSGKSRIGFNDNKIDFNLFPDRKTLVADMKSVVSCLIMVKKEKPLVCFPCQETYSFHFEIVRFNFLKKKTIKNLYGKIGLDLSSKCKADLHIWSAHPDNYTVPQSCYNNWIKSCNYLK